MPDRTPPSGGPPAESVDLSRIPHDSLGEAVVSVVADHTGKSIRDLDSLVEVVDPDALEALCRGEEPGSPGNLRTIRFEYEGLLVSISQCEQLRIRPLDGRGRSDSDR